MTSPTPTASLTLLDRCDEFTNRVLRACAEPATRAALRSAAGLSPERATRAHLAMGRLLPRDAREGHREAAHYALAAILATYDHSHGWSGPQRRRNIGLTLAELAERNLLAPASATTRIERLARVSPAGLLEEYRRIATLARRPAALVYCDWGLWLHSAVLWPQRRPQLAKEWAYAYAHLSPVVTPEESATA